MDVEVHRTDHRQTLAKVPIREDVAQDDIAYSANKYQDQVQEVSESYGKKPVISILLQTRSRYLCI